MTDTRYIRQDVNYLGFLESQLRGLGGIETMAYELIQNADDVHREDGSPGATSISFDVCDDALIVHNNGTFRAQDFDRMREIAGAAKRREEGTTGAFGIGFISVYQVTDTPEIVSAGRRWVIHPEEDADRRIWETPDESPETTFRLPWAVDPQSGGRQGLRLETVDTTRLDAIVADICTAVERSALFLKQIEHVEVRRNGSLVLSSQRDIATVAGYVELRITGKTLKWQLWRVLDLDFAEEGNALKAAHPVQIEAKRHTKVKLAVCGDLSARGRLYATLPTDSTYDLPFCIDADFYPTPDRKQILFGSDYQGQWNRAAIRAACRGVRDHLDEIRETLGPVAFTGMLDQMQSLTRTPTDRKLDPVFDEFWECLTPSLNDRSVVFTQAEKWVQPAEARLVQLGPKGDAEALLSAIGMDVVHVGLGRYANLLTSNAVGVSLLSIEHIALALQALPIVAGRRPDELPAPLDSLEGWQRLWEILQQLLEPNRLSRSSTYASVEISRLRDLPIALNAKGSISLPNRLFHGDAATRTAFPFAPWLDPSLEEHPLFGRLVVPLQLATAIQILARFDSERFEHWITSGILGLSVLYDWLSAHLSSEALAPTLVTIAAQIPIWPSSGEYRSAAEVYLPTGFTDPLRVSDLVDLETISGYTDLARRMGMRDLDFGTYASIELPKWFAARAEADMGLVPADVLARLVAVLANNMGKVRDSEQTRSILAQLPLIACSNGSQAPAEIVYFDNNDTRLLGRSTLFASGSLSPSTDALYEWLGVSRLPRPRDLVARIAQVTSRKREPRASAYIERVFEHLGGRFTQLTAEERNDLAPLRDMAWLPGSADATKWYPPKELYAVYQDYLFATQACFLELPRTSQTGHAGFVRWLGVSVEPSTKLVVNHLLACAKADTPVNPQVYRRLSEALDREEIEVNRLVGVRCILSADGTYIDPRKAFWSEHDFGRYRITLSADSQEYRPLFTKIGVRERPEWRDYVSVLQDVSEEFSEFHHTLDEQALSIVVSCWQHLSAALGQESIRPSDLADLRNEPLVPDASGMMRAPSDLLMEDRPHIAEHFRDSLGSRLIARHTGTWPALRAAGVLRLSESVEVKLLEPPIGSPSVLLKATIEQRLPLVARVVEGVKQDVNISNVVRLRDIDLVSSDRLRVQYQLKLGRGAQPSSPVDLPVLLLDDTLYVHSNGATPWAALARELAYVLKPDGEVTSLAPGLKEALSYPDFEQAERAMDQLAIPPLAADTAAIIGYEPVQTATADPSPDTSEVPDSAGGEASGNGPATDVTGVPNTTNNDGSERRLDDTDAFDNGGTAPTQRDTPDTPKDQDPPRTIGTPPVPPRTKRHSRVEERLTSYIDLGSDEEQTTNPEHAERLRTVEMAGVKFAADFEEREGRTPHVQSHTNPGFDILSVDSEGCERYIEVKSLSGTWDARNPVRVTPMEYQKARCKGEDYWLYVVEQALSETPVLYRIRAFSGRVFRYCLDYGWHEAAEIDGNDG